MLIIQYWCSSFSLHLLFQNISKIHLNAKRDYIIIFILYPIVFITAILSPIARVLAFSIMNIILLSLLSEIPNIIFVIITFNHTDISHHHF